MNENSKLPKAYKTGLQNFYGRDFKVNQNVLIPRPETETIIDLVLTLSGKPYLPGLKAGPRKLPEKPKIVDVGTGSGCIAITLKLELPEAEITATDISPEALLVAKENAVKFGVPINYIISHLLEKVNFTPDLVVANLPYVDRNWDWLDLESLSFEPETALFAADQGLALIKELLRAASSKKIPRLILEADPSEHPAIIAYAKKYGYKMTSYAPFVLSGELS
ncbi:MAG: HemK family protein methyltransferase [Candidatus Saccharibacteria bacterium]|nr:HemK family protein methyltransferase [Candidatus Saccharibacteria bacterium]